MVYELLAKSALTELTDFEVDAVDHYLEIAGIDQWALDFTKQKEEDEEEEERRLRKQRGIRRDDLHRKVKADRLAAIQAGLKGTKAQSPGPTVSSEEAVPPPTPDSQPPHDPHQEPSNTFTSTNTTLEVCPIHTLWLV